MKKLLLLIMLLTLVGCEKMTEENGLYAFVKNQNIAPFSLVQNADLTKLTTLQNDLQKLDNIYDVVIVEGQEELLIVYKVKHLKRFKMQAIEKEVKEIAKDRLNEDLDIIVSSDYKIYLETIRLHNRINNQSDEKKSLKTFDWIIQLQKEMT